MPNGRALNQTTSLTAVYPMEATTGQTMIPRQKDALMQIMTGYATCHMHSKDAKTGITLWCRIEVEGARATMTNYGFF